MSGAIKRMPGEKFAEFAARQKAAQTIEREEHERAIKNQRAMRKARNRKSEIPDDFDYSMNH